MSSCSNIPVELVLATTDPKLYDSKNNKWLWSGQMYWAVECLPHRQTTVSDRMIPNIRPDQYMKLNSSPAIWDYCKSNHCGSNSDSMQVIFTFNPHSTNPNDFLQYVIDIHCQATDQPRHDINDNAGNKLYLDIVEISKMSNYPYAEIWIARTHEEKGIIALEKAHKEIIKKLAKKPAPKMYIYVIIAIVLVLLVALTFGVIFIFRRPKISTESTIGSRNIG